MHPSTKIYFCNYKKLILAKKIKRTIFEVSSNPFFSNNQINSAEGEKNRDMEKRQNQNSSEILPLRCF